MSQHGQAGRASIALTHQAHSVGPQSRSGPFLFCKCKARHYLCSFSVKFIFWCGSSFSNTSLQGRASAPLPCICIPYGPMDNAGGTPRLGVSNRLQQARPRSVIQSRKPSANSHSNVQGQEARIRPGRHLKQISLPFYPWRPDLGCGRPSTTSVHGLTGK